MCRGYVGVFQNQCFWLWSPAGSQAIDQVVWLISALDFGWLPIPCFGSVLGGSQPLIRFLAHPGAFCLCSQGASPPGVSGVGPRPLIGGTHPLGHFGSGAQAAGPLIRVHAHLRFQVWAPSPLIRVHASMASGERWGCFSVFTVQGLRGEGRQRPWLLRRVL